MVEACPHYPCGDGVHVEIEIWLASCRDRRQPSPSGAPNTYTETEPTDVS